MRPKLLYGIFTFFLLCQNTSTVDLDLSFLKSVKISDINAYATRLGINLPGPNPNSEIGKMINFLGIDKYIKNMTIEKIPEFFVKGLETEQAPQSKEVALEFDISSFFKNVTADDLPKLLISLFNVGSQRSNTSDEDATQLIAIQDTFSNVWAAAKCEIDRAFCDAPPKTTDWSMCFLCVISRSYVKNSEGFVVHLQKNNLEQYPEAEKMYIEGSKFDFIPKLIFPFFQQLHALGFCCSALETIDTHFLPDNADKLLDLQVDRNTIRRIGGYAFRSARRLEKLQLDRNQIQDLDKNAFGGLGSLKFLNLSTNRISILDKSQFVELHQLEHLILDENSIERFEEDTFKNLWRLQNFSAQHNWIQYINKETFTGLDNLQELKLNGNRLTNIEARTFSDMAELRILELNNNHIKNIQENAFTGCSSLEKISLENNQIQMLAGKTISQLSNLKEINVMNNICINETFKSLQEASDQLQMNCDPKPNNCLVPNIMNGWITTAQGQINVTVGSKFDYEMELAEVHCEPGYSLLLEKTMDNLVACEETNDGNSSTWNKDFLQCQRLCSISELMGRTARATTCQDGEGKNYDCRDKSRVGTKVSVLCKPGYELPKYVEVSKEFTCLNDGHWDHKLFDCIPICGKSTPRAQTFIVSGIESDVTEYPWNVAVYRTKPNKTAPELICGGTIISERLVISAAHCYFEDIIRGVKMNPIESFKIVTGKFYNDFNAKEAYPLQTFGLSEIIKHTFYRGQFGYYNYDIALLALNGFMEFWPHTAPICLELNLGYDQKFLKAGSQGKVAGWGLTTKIDRPSEVLKSINVPVVSLDECREEASEAYQPFITDDKLCAGTKDGAGVCKGDSGAGLVFLKSNESKSYYLWGIVSNGPQTMAGIGGCDLKFYSVYTNVQYYIPLIKQALKKYPSN